MANRPKVLLITAKTVRPKYQCMPLIGVAYIASYLRERGIDVDILDATALDVSYEGVVEYVSFYGFDFVGVTAIAATYQSALRHLREIKEAHPEIITVIGGPHATALHEQVVMENDFVDYCVRGEGEITAYDLIDTLWKGGDVSKVKGVTFKRDGEVTITPPRPYIEDLDILPYPALDLMPLHEYYFEMRGLATRKDLVLPFCSGRGCYSNCGFCASKMMWGGPRMRTVDKVIEELVWMREKYDMDVLFSYDDIMSANRKWLIEFCQKFIEAGLNDIRWSCDARADTLTDEMLMWLKKANCAYVLLGLEFGTQRLLDMTNKKLKLSKVKEAVKMIRKHGINSCGSFIIGYPTETKQEILQTGRFARSLNLDAVLTNLAVPYPGTEMYDFCVKHDLLLGNLDDEAYGSPLIPMVKLEGITPEETVKLLGKVHRIIKFSPQYVANKIRNRLTT